MTFAEASEKYDIPVKVFYALHKKGALPYQLQNEHIDKIEFLSLVWGKDIFLRMQLSRKNKKKREKLINEADLNKVEQYILNRYLNAIESGERLHKPQIANEVRTYLGAPITAKLFETIEQMRKKAYYMIGKSKKDDADKS
jgi:hypothetical protein